MFRINGGLTHATGTFVETSYRSVQSWAPVPTHEEYGDVVNHLLIGDETKGPSLSFVSQPPGEKRPAYAHAHASDSFRLPIHGAYTMGSQERYEPGDFRFQDGWKPYASQGVDAAGGVDGMWSFLMFGDRRGVLARYSGQLPEGFAERA